MVLQRTKLGVIAFLILQLATACVSAPTSPPTPPPSPTPGPVDLVMAFQDAINRGAIDEAVAMFHDAPAGLAIPVPFNVRLTDVRDVTEFEVGLGLKLELTGCQLEGNAVNCQMLLNDDCIKTIVPGGLTGTARIKFLDGKINLLTTTVPDGDAEKKWSDAMCCKINNWVGENRADELIKLNSSAAAGTSWQKHGELSGKLCADYAAATK